jgi:hypothetical protein
METTLSEIGAENGRKNLDKRKALKYNNLRVFFVKDLIKIAEFLNRYGLLLSFPLKGTKNFLFPLLAGKPDIPVKR